MDRSKKYLFVCSRLDTMVFKRKYLIQLLVDSGADVSLVSMERHSESEDFLSRIGVSYKYIKCQRNKISPLFDLFYLVRLYLYLKFSKPDVVIGYTIKPNLYSGLVLRLLRGEQCFYPVVTGLGFAFQGGGFLRCILKNYVILLHRIAFTVADKIILQNESNKELFETFGISKVNKMIVVKGDGVELQPFTCRKYNERKKFVTVSRILGEKGLRELHQAVRLVKKNYPWFVLDLYGPMETSPDAITVEEIEQWHKEGTIVWKGYCSDVGTMLESADAFVLPSYHEGMCTSVCEAISYGLPVVGSDIPGIREMVSGNGFLVPPKSVDKLAEAIRKVLSLPEATWTMMGKKSRLIAENEFDRHVLMQKIYDIVS